MWTCPQCNEINPQGARTCKRCGGQGSAASKPIDEYRRVTVLFADIVQSTALIASCDPEDARDLLNSVVRRMRRVVRQFGGSVIHVAGDGIKALFGAPHPLEEHALHACLAANQLQTEVARSPPSEASAADLQLRIRIGIHTGKVILCTVESDLHVEYSAEGLTTHIAAKAQSAADPGTTVVTAEVAQTVQGFVSFRSRAPLVIPDIRDPIPLFELVALSNARSRFDVSLANGLTPFVGRDAELRILQSAAVRAAEGEFVVLGLVGEAGVGKSRLLWELRSRLEEQRWTVIHVHATRSGAAVALHPLLDALRAMLGIESTDDPLSIAARVTRQLADNSRSRVSPLLALLGVPVADEKWTALDTRERMARSRAALLDALVSGCGKWPTAIMIDDLHESDAETQEFVALMLKRAHRARLLLLLEYRTGYVFRFEQYQTFNAVAIEPLDSQDATALFAQLAGIDDSLDRLRRQLLDRVEGNPLFIEEGVRMLRETGAIWGSRGSARATSTDQDLPLLGSVLDLIQSRIARLPAEVREVLLIAAIGGKDVQLSMMRSLTGLPLGELAERLGALVASGLLRRGGDESAGEYAFRHALTHEVAYSIKTRSDRQQIHTRIVSLLESTQYEELRDRLELLAHHSLQACDWERSFKYLQGSSKRAAGRSALREAVRLLELALEVLPKLAASQPAVDREIALRLELSWLLVVLGKMTRAGAEVERLEALAPNCVDVQLLGRLEAFVSGHRWLSGEHGPAVAAGRRAVAIATQSGETSLLVPARLSLAGGLLGLGQFDEAEGLLTANMKVLSENATGQEFSLGGMPAVLCRSARAWLYEQLGRFPEAESDARDALRISTANDHAFSVMSATFAAGVVCLTRADFSRAEALLASSLIRCKSHRQWMWLPVLGSMLALTIARQSRSEDARAVIGATVPRIDKDVLMSSYTTLTIARVFALTGQCEQAIELVQGALRNARRQAAQPWVAESLLLRAELLRRGATPSLVSAEEDCQAGREIARELGLRPLASRCNLAIGQILLDSGRTSAASPYLKEARAGFDALGLDELTWQSWQSEASLH